MLLLCFCHTVAGRTGALAGFGLSLAKWAAIVRNSTDLVADSNTWLLWLIMALGESPELCVGKGNELLVRCASYVHFITKTRLGSTRHFISVYFEWKLHAAQVDGRYKD